MTPMTGRHTWPVPDPADTARALAGIDGDIRRGLPPKIDDALIVLAGVRAADATPDPDPGQPVPFTLTPKAHAALDSDDTPPGPGEWGCDQCGAAWFGTPPEDGLCPACRAEQAVTAWPAPGPCPGPGADWREAGWCCRTCAVLAHPSWCPDCRGARQ